MKQSTSESAAFAGDVVSAPRTGHSQVPLVVGAGNESGASVRTKTQPDVSIVIVSWNARAYLVQCLKSIEATAGGTSYEVLVVDNASSDSSPDAVREGSFRSVRLIETGANLGFARGNNVGLKLCSGRYYALINSDVELKEGCLQRLIAYMDANVDVGLAGPRLFNADGSYQASCRFEPRLSNHLARALFFNTSLADPAYKGAATTEVEVLAGAFWIARREAVEQVEFLDEAFFFYGEDVDWCRRFRDAGWRVCFHPEAEAIHFGGASSDADPARFNLELQRAVLQLWEKYHGRLSTLAFLLIGLLYHGLRVIGCVLRLKPRTGNEPDHKRKLRRHISALQWNGHALLERLGCAEPRSIRGASGCNSTE
jgi:hypothetical protein